MKRNIKKLSTLVSPCIVSVILIYASTWFVSGALKYLDINKAISEVEYQSTWHGWTNELHDEVEGLKAEREVLVANNKSAEFCYIYSHTTTEVLFRNAAIVFAVAVAAISIFILACNIRDIAIVAMIRVMKKSKNKKPSKEKDHPEDSIKVVFASDLSQVKFYRDELDGNGPVRIFPIEKA